MITHRVSAGPFTHIYDPSIGEAEPWYINDHCFVHGHDGLWHMFGITHAEPANSAEEKSLAHATAASLAGGPWTKQPFALTADPAAGETHLWAPHVLRHGGMYYMYYCAGGNNDEQYRIHLATSPDLRQWQRVADNPVVTAGFHGRDPCVIRVRDQWVMYYTATSEPAGGWHIVAAQVSDDLVHWREPRTVFTCRFKGKWGGGTESPFVVEKDGAFYLFIGPRSISDDYDYGRDYDRTQVFASRDPFHFDINEMVGEIPAHAAEVAQDLDGQWYVSRCGWGRGGLYLAPLMWG
ncbi:MAG TPA: hypothetical protein VGN72_02480 [Tepidisphaeraceae bacterium]|jgi:beta-xylosidase|nr:hypothetical protein [Tepidisphaeraceae bacterium]